MVSVFPFVTVLLSEIISGNQRIYFIFVVYDETLFRINAVTWKVDTDEWMSIELVAATKDLAGLTTLINFVKLTRNLALLIT